MKKDRAAVALPSMPKQADLLIAAACGLSYVAWCDAGRPEPGSREPRADTRHPRAESREPRAESRPALQRLVLPWAALPSDNRKTGVFKGRVVLQRGYRKAKRMCSAAAAEQWSGAPWLCRLAMRVVLYPPDAQPRDLTNRAKALHDALQDVCYADDQQLDDVHYLRGPIDREHPRAEIEIRPL